TVLAYSNVIAVPLAAGAIMDPVTALNCRAAIVSAQTFPTIWATRPITASAGLADGQCRVAYRFTTAVPPQVPAPLRTSSSVRGSPSLQSVPAPALPASRHEPAPSH